MTWENSVINIVIYYQSYKVNIYISVIYTAGSVYVYVYDTVCCNVNCNYKYGDGS